MCFVAWKSRERNKVGAGRRRKNRRDAMHLWCTFHMWYTTPACHPYFLPPIPSLTHKISHNALFFLPNYHKKSCETFSGYKNKMLLLLPNPSVIAVVVTIVVVTCATTSHHLCHGNPTPKSTCQHRAVAQ